MSYKGPKIDDIASQFGMLQLINEPNFILPETLSFNDLNFVSQPNILMESEVHSLLLQRCYHQMVQSIQEWTKYNLWKTAFKKFERIWSA